MDATVFQPDFFMTFLQFVGDPRGHSGPYTFHNGFRFFKHGKCKVITLGQFFFVRISARDDPCIGELLMLWDDRHNNQRLSSVRLYFLPEQTPEGRLSFHGEVRIKVLNSLLARSARPD